MSLSKQMIIFIASMLIVLLAGTFMLNLNNTKSFLEQQLQSHAQDTATSLGLSLSSVADPEDPSSMNTMINAVFDRGYYSHITLNDVDEQLIFERKNPQKIEGIPSWFINMISINAPVAESLIQSGWMPIGNLTVQSHPGYAYVELWKTAVSLLIWFTIAAIVAIALAVYALKIMLKPLKQMEKQAEAIVKKEYILQDNMPTTVEFKQVVSAMNAMVNKMKEVFDRDAKNAEKLQKMAYQDSVTGLSNRLHFEMNIDALLDVQAEASPGAMCLLRVQGLKELNDQFGYMIGDKLMKMLSDKMTQSLNFDGALYARLNGTELIVVAPSIRGEQLSKYTADICQTMPSILEDLKASSAPTSVSAALMDYQPGNKRGPLLAKLDFAIHEADKKGQNQSFYYQPETSNTNQDVRWQDIISDAFEHKRFVLFQQAAYDHQRQVHDKELLIRLKDQDGTVHSAGYFMPAVQQLNRVSEIDQMVAVLALEYLEKQPQKTSEILAINLTQSIIEDTDFKQWLLENVKNLPHNQLAFEMSELLVNENKAKSWPLINELRALSIGFGIDHFGSHFANMNYLQELRPDYIKLDASFTKAIERDEQTRSYISSLYEMCNSLDIQIIAMSVENESQIAAFEELGISYFQGYYFGAPKPL